MRILLNGKFYSDKVDYGKFQLKCSGTISPWKSKNILVKKKTRMFSLHDILQMINGWGQIPMDRKTKLCKGSTFQFVYALQGKE